MKKFFVLFCVLVLVAGVAIAEDIGVTVGADFYFNNINKANDDEWNPIIMPYAAFDTSFGDLDFHTELDYYFDFYPNFEDISQYLDFDLTLTYNLSLGSASTLLFEVDNQLSSFAISPDFNSYVEGSLTPRVRFTQKTDFGSFFAQVTTPIGYLDDDSGILLRSRLGWTSTFGLRLWTQLDSSLDPMEIYQGWRVFVAYGADSFSLDVTTRGYKDTSTGYRIDPNFEYYLGDATLRVGGILWGVGTDGMNINVTPGVDYSLGALAFYIECEFADVTAKKGEMSISPALGVSFSF